MYWLMRREVLSLLVNIDFASIQVPPGDLNICCPFSQTKPDGWCSSPGSVRSSDGAAQVMVPVWAAVRPAPAELSRRHKPRVTPFNAPCRFSLTRHGRIAPYPC